MNPHDAQPQGQPPCGLRVLERDGRHRRQQRLWLLLALVVCGCAGAYLMHAMWSTQAHGNASDQAARTTATPAPKQESRVSPTSVARPAQMAPTADQTPSATAPPSVADRADFELPSLDPNDLAAHIRPGDPEPTMAEVIRGLHEAGIREGLGAFNPPGTVPLLPGIAVPEDFVLPPGYVRHYQVTDEGEMLEAVLMFSPDHPWLDANGQPIPLPDDGLVPPEMAPPGMPIEPIRLPEPPQG